MNRNKYKYFDKLYLQETKHPESRDYYSEWYGYDHKHFENFWEYEYYLNSKYHDWYGDWLDDPKRLRDFKIDEILSGEMGNLGLIMPKSLFK
jgi:hypothetical protein